MTDELVTQLVPARFWTQVVLLFSLVVASQVSPGPTVMQGTDEG